MCETVRTEPVPELEVVPQGMLAATISVTGTVGGTGKGVEVVCEG